jgi:uncharacterized membrane protein YgaE (UPF0421/DUF939 family)
MEIENNQEIKSDDQPTDLLHRITNYLIKNSPGMRVVKTALAIILCLLIQYYRGSEMPYHACIATIVCMQPTLKSTFKSAVDRTLGTIIAGVYAYLLAVFLIGKVGMIPSSLQFNLLIGALSFPLMAVMIAIKKPTSLAITVIVYLVIMLSVNALDPLPYTIERVLGTLIGIAVALFVNWLPPLNKLGKIFGTVLISEAGDQRLEVQNR